MSAETDCAPDNFQGKRVKHWTAQRVRGYSKSQSVSLDDQIPHPSETQRPERRRACHLLRRKENSPQVLLFRSCRSLMSPFEILVQVAEF